MNGMKAVTDLAVFLSKNMSQKVFKYEKALNYIGEYIVVNNLPFSFGSSLVGSLNVNIHVPNLGNGQADTKRMSEILNEINLIIPHEALTEDFEPLEINGAYFSIESDSNLMSDNDNTHFINLRVKVLYNALNQ